MLLAIDTSTNWASLALLRDGVPLASRNWAIGQQHSTQIFAGIDALLASAGVAQADVTALAVATGPGSFNGTRVAVTTAKTLAFVWGVPLVGIPTLDGIAEDALRILDEFSDLAVWDGTILAVLEAGRDELYTCWYALKGGEPDGVRYVQPHGPIIIAGIAEIAATAPAGDIILHGEYSAVHGAAFKAAFGDARFSMADSPAPERAIGIGRLAHRRLLMGERDDPLALEPTYVRRPNITVSARWPHPPAPSSHLSDGEGETA